MRLAAAVLTCLALPPLVLATPARVYESPASPAATEPAPAPAPTAPDQARANLERQELGRAAIVKGREAHGMVAFTFDDGPDHDTTPRVLEALERYDVPAAFFVVGRRISGKSSQVQKNVAVLADIASRGYLIGNHTFNHEDLSAIDEQAGKDAIDKNTRALSRVLGYVPQLFRPPFGRISGAARKHIAGRGFTEVRWSIDTKDFLASQARTLRQRTVARILAEHGGVVLMHDTKHVTADTVAGILDDLEAENCRLLAAGQPPIVPVTLHYFLREKNGTARPVPPEVQARTDRYINNLRGRCQRREAIQDAAQATSPQ